METIVRRVPARDTQRVDSAGIIPYCVTDDRRVLVLLGRERFERNWTGSRRWSAFSGATVRAETPCETATREFLEESLAVAQPPDARGGFARNWPAHTIASNRHDYGVHLTVRGDCRDRTQMTYVLRSRWVPHMCEEFALRARILREIAHMGARVHAARSKFPATTPFLCEDMVVSHRGGARVVGAIEFVNLHEDMLTVIFESSDATTSAVDTIVLSLDAALHEAARAYVDWFDLRKRTSEYVRAVQADVAGTCAVHATWNASGMLTSVSVDQACLEKEQVMFWTLDDLRDVVANRGNSRHGKFRLYFLPSLHAALGHLERVEQGLHTPTVHAAR